MLRSVEEINGKIKSGKAVVLTAEEMTTLVKREGVKKAAKTVDVVTTGTFGPMCSSGVFFNFGHWDPPIKMKKIILNNVEAYGGIAAVDCYLGAAQPSVDRGEKYGGGHVIEDLLKGHFIELRAEGATTDCYPTDLAETFISLEDLNQAIMCNPRNSYQRYNAAINSSSKNLYTYLGKLLPHIGNIAYSGAGELSPLSNDPDFITIGIGSRIFLGGTTGLIIDAGTQHNPSAGFGTLMVKGNLKHMSSQFIRGATIKGYGPSLYIGIGIPIPILDEYIAECTGISDEEIFVDILDFSIPSRTRPSLAKVSYSQLKSGHVKLNGKEVPVSSLSSMHMARKVANKLKAEIMQGGFFLSEPVEAIPKDTTFKALEKRENVLEKIKNKQEDNLENYPIFIDRKKCISCGYCIPICPKQVFSFTPEKTIKLNLSNCIFCKVCEETCPCQAITITRM